MGTGVSILLASGGRYPAGRKKQNPANPKNLQGLFYQIRLVGLTLWRKV